jgi:error-prone DNA polymerase
MSLSEHVICDYSTLSLSLKGHPVSFIREKFKSANVVSTRDLLNHDNGDIIKIAGLVLVRQRPGTAGGVCFMTIEDEDGNPNLVVFRNLFEDVYRKEILQSKLLMVRVNFKKKITLFI